MPDDKIKREFEDILNKLDEFVPEESATERMQNRSSGAVASGGLTTGTGDGATVSRPAHTGRETLRSSYEGEWRRWGEVGSSVHPKSD